MSKNGRAGTSSCAASKPPAAYEQIIRTDRANRSHGSHGVRDRPKKISQKIRLVTSRQTRLREGEERRLSCLMLIRQHARTHNITATSLRKLGANLLLFPSLLLRPSRASNLGGPKDRFHVELGIPGACASAAPCRTPRRLRRAAGVIYRPGRALLAIKPVSRCSLRALRLNLTLLGQEPQRREGVMRASEEGCEQILASRGRGLLLNELLERLTLVNDGAICKERPVWQAEHRMFVIHGRHLVLKLERE
jgi:hypothetical protein